uniref:NADH dehydrogenase subunit 6 n=1 Tax=Dryinus sp. ZJUH_2016011 TaxID=2491175 RepID=A0A3Q8U9N5_9HYME|nr:NADH dehydrogenase subunit 6 [Dryinus sp. ZJUH_2016011]
MYNMSFEVYFIMLNMMIIMMMITPLMIIYMHPVSFNIMLVMTCILFMILFTLNSNTSLYSFMIFMIMIGGMIMLISYFSSIIMNTKSATNYKIKLSSIIFSFLVILLVFLLIYKMFMYMNLISYNFYENMDLNQIKIMYCKIKNLNNIHFLFLFKNNTMTMSIMFMILYMLILMIKSILKFNRPMRMFMY